MKKWESITSGRLYRALTDEIEDLKLTIFKSRIYSY